MTDSGFVTASAEGAASAGQSNSQTAPQFGAIDIVEAFTAMRHEWRGQAKESRQLIELVQAAVQRLESLEAKQRSPTDPSHIESSEEMKRWTRLVVDNDYQLSRAIEAIGQAEHRRMTSEVAQQDALADRFAAMNPLARWFARPLRDFWLEQCAKQASHKHSLLEGLNLMAARSRVAMQELGLERIDVLGMPFDGTLMNAVGTVPSRDYAPGHVAEQLVPCYRWNGQLLRFADVRVAQPTIDAP